MNFLLLWIGAKNEDKNGEACVSNISALSFVCSLDQLYRLTPDTREGGSHQKRKTRDSRHNLALVDLKYIYAQPKHIKMSLMEILKQIT